MGLFFPQAVQATQANYKVLVLAILARKSVNTHKTLVSTVYNNLNNVKDRLHGCKIH
jgi:hypothetical protein